MTPRTWILVAALLLRLATAAAFPSLHHPDENFQFFEQAHRLAFGYGVVPWELEDGIRSLLLPALFARLIRALADAGASPLVYIFACRAVLACVSLLAVAAVYDYGRRISQTHALIAGVVAATWFELVYFAGRPLNEAMATDFLILALSLASPIPRELRASRLAWIGACIGLCLMLRVQLAPGLAVLTPWICGREWRRRWLPLLAGAAMPLVIFGASDWVAWGSPFHSQIAAFRVNYLEGKASRYGVEPWYWYLTALVQIWSVMLPVIEALVVVRRGASAPWIAVALVIIATHSLIPHKEYRFVFPALACLVIVAALASADLVEAASRRFARQAIGFQAAVCALWIVSSYVRAAAPGFAPYWFKDSNALTVESALSSRPELCGLLIYDDPFYETGGYAFLHRNVPIYRRPAGHSQDEIERIANFAMVRRMSLAGFSGRYRTGYCLGSGSPHDFCLIARPGGCSVDPAIPSLLQERRLGE